MKKDKGKGKFLKVTVVKYYHIPMHNKTASKINGWSIKEIIQSWFKDFSLGGFHATRDSHHLSSADTFKKATIITEKQFSNEMQNRYKKQSS